MLGRMLLVTCGLVASGASVGDSTVRETGTRDDVDARVETNLGELRAVEFGGHVLTSPGSADRGDGPLVLYAPSEVDDPTYRATISAMTGGSVDYFDARVATPSVSLLTSYDVVLVWANFAFADTVAYGDALAAASTKGTMIVLGAFVTYDLGNSLQGQIRNPGYSPVWNPTGSNHFFSSPWAGGDCGFGWYDALAPGGVSRFYRDTIELQGPGTACGYDVDQTPTAAFNAPGKSFLPVVMANGSGGSPLGNPPDEVRWLSNIIIGGVGSGGGTVDCVCDPVYQVGARVVRTAETGSGGPVLGTHGTVYSGGDLGLLVGWDGFVGHDGLGVDVCPPNPTPGNGWYVKCDEVDATAPVSCACNGAFSVGDRVVLTEDIGVLGVGATGTVFSAADPIVFPDQMLVAWDGYEGHNGNGFDFCPPNPTPGNGWYVFCTLLAREGSDFEFGDPVEIAQVKQPGAFGIADIDGSNGLDIGAPLGPETPGGNGSFAAFLNDGTGVGFETVRTAVGPDPVAATMADFDGVNGPDAAVADGLDDTVTILLNDGAGEGTFIVSQVIVVGPTPSAIDKGDADGDGDIDLVVTHLGDGTAMLLVNDGTGQFAVGLTFFVGNGPRAVRFAEFGPDAPGPTGLDFVVANSDDDEVVIFENDGGGGFEEGERVTVPGGPLTVDPEDLDHDKDRDMVVGACDSDVITVIVSDGAGGFTTTEVPAADCPSSVEITDIDGDGDEDIVAVTGPAGGLPVARAVTVIQDLFVETGQLQFAFAGQPVLSDDLRFVRAGLLDGDLRPDIIAVGGDATSGAVTVVTNATSTVDGDVNGDGVVDILDLLAVLAAWGDCPAPPITCPEDLDDDGNVDVSELLEVLANWN